ncbi:Uncharacterised protein [Candidatus Venteria ishoeyi]|uniref:Type II secretion system protein G n=1 Tax=Candidatus Venteria ishoeyi TaxID=1899563 RepID=A0A1H6F437_9GAMM|nr:Uncharacterised protein [Candidatus Venteria ishoeyi]
MLEILIVLLLIGLLSALVMPRLSGIYDSIQAAMQRDEVFSQINALGYLAFQQKQGFVLESLPMVSSTLPLELPADWTLQTETPIYYLANGACSGGRIYLQYQQHTEQEQNWVADLSPPFCHLQAD